MWSLRRSATSSSPSPQSAPPSPSRSWMHLRSLPVLSPLAHSAPLSSSVPTSSSSPDCVSLRAQSLQQKGKHALSQRAWCSMRTPSGRFRDGGAKFLKKVRRGGVDPSIRTEVWPFLLGVYDLKSSEGDRVAMKTKKRKEYEKLRRHCRKLLDEIKKENLLKTISEVISEDSSAEGPESPCCLEVGAGEARDSIEVEEAEPRDSVPSSPADFTTVASSPLAEVNDTSGTCVDPVSTVTESSGSESSDEEVDRVPQIEAVKGIAESGTKFTRCTSLRETHTKPVRTSEDFATWQRLIRLDSMRVDAAWVLHAPRQAAVTNDKAVQRAESVSLKDFDHLEACMIYHAARLVAILEAYAIYDPEIGYCQGMSDILSPIVAVMEEDHDAFWCFVGFMRKARHNFRLDEVGIRRQLNIISQIIKYKDSQLYKHLEKLKAEDCFFVYRMVLVLFRRELTFEQTLSLWEVMWADQAAVQAGIRRSLWGKIRLRAPPTNDLLLYAIAACILQRRKLIIQKYSSMDDILRECNSMAGQLDVWRLLDDAHDLVMNLHEKIQ